jgi:hypothetical protein
VTHPTLHYELAVARQRDALEAAAATRRAEHAQRAAPTTMRLRARLHGARRWLHAAGQPGHGAGEEHAAMARVSANENEERHEMSTHDAGSRDGLVATGE